MIVVRVIRLRERCIEMKDYKSDAEVYAEALRLGFEKAVECGILELNGDKTQAKMNKKVYLSLKRSPLYKEYPYLALVKLIVDREDEYDYDIKSLMVMAIARIYKIPAEYPEEVIKNMNLGTYQQNLNEMKDVLNRESLK